MDKKHLIRRRIGYPLPEEVIDLIIKLAYEKVPKIEITKRINIEYPNLKVCYRTVRRHTIGL